MKKIINAVPYIIFLFISLISLRIIFILEKDIALGHNWDWTLPDLDFLFKKMYIFSAYTWWDYNLGIPLDLTVSHLIPNTIMSLLPHIFTLKTINVLLLFSVVVVSFLSFRKFADFIIYKRPLNCIPAILFAFSPFLFNEIIGGSWYMWISYAFAPLFFLKLLKYVETKATKQLIGLLVSGIFVISSLQDFFLLEVIVVLFLTYKVASKEYAFNRTINRYVSAHAVLAVFNLYWILPLIGSFAHFYKSTVNNPALTGSFDAVKTSTQTILHILTLDGYLDRNMYYYALPGFLVPLYFIFISLAWILILSPIVLKKQSSRYEAIPWLSILLVLIILIKGGNPPFGNFTMWFFNSFPLMKMYRSPQHMMFAAALIVPVLMAYSLNYLYNNIKYKRTIVSLFSICVFIWISGWWYTGDMGHETLKQKKGDYIDFYTLSPGLRQVYLRNERSAPDHRVLFLPAVSSPQYKKTEYQAEAQGGQPEYLYLKNPTFTSESNQFANAAEALLGRAGEFDSLSYLRLFAVSDIVLRSDIMPHFTESSSYWEAGEVRKRLDSTQWLNKFLEGKYETGYSIKPDYFLPQIYSSSHITFVAGNADSLTSPLQLTSYLYGCPALVFTDQQSPNTLRALINRTAVNNSGTEKQFLDMAAVVISKGMPDEHNNGVFPGPASYLFYKDNKNIKNMLKDKEKSADIKLGDDNPFEIGKRQFYIPEARNYSMAAFVKPKRDFLKSDIISGSNNSSSVSLSAISGWNIGALNTTYKQRISEDGMHIDAYYQGTGDVHERISLTRKFSDISIKERPYLAFSCKLADLGVQEIEMDIKLSDAEGRISGLKVLNIKAGNGQNIADLYKTAKDEFGKKVADNLFVSEIVLNFNKKNGAKLPREKRAYPFVFKNIAFLKTQPIPAEFDDELSGFLSGIYYYFDGNGEMKNVDFPEQIPWNIKNIYKLETQKVINLKETPELKLSFPKPAVDEGTAGGLEVAEGERRNERQGVPNEMKVILGLDFNGGGKESGRIEMLVPAFGMVDGKLMLNVHAYEEVKRKFPNMKHYDLVSIGISRPNDKDVFFQTVQSKKLIRYRENKYKPSDFKAGANVVMVDKKLYKMAAGKRSRAKGEKNKAEDNSRIEFGNIYLKKGDHNLNVLENDKYRAELVEIKPVESEELEVGSHGPPKIEFRKINPTRYIVDVKEAKGPFTLVFSESFHEGWKAYMRRQAPGARHEAIGERREEPLSALWSAWEDRGKRAELKDHFVVNGYANGWIVPVIRQAMGNGHEAIDERQKAKGEGQGWKGEDREKGLQDFQIVLEFEPQRLFETGLLVSTITLAGCLLYAGYERMRRRNG